MATGLSHTCALSAAGLSCWGSNSQGQLGVDTPTSTAPITAPMPVPLVANPIAIAAGAQHTCAVRSTGAVLCWGQNGTGQLGEGSMSSLAEPVPVTGLDTGVAVSAGATFTCARTSDGAVFCWGDDHDGELGTGRGVTETRPVPLPATAKAIAAGGAHTCGVMPSATTARRPGFSCWGSNQAGQLGDNDGDDRAHPAPIEQPLVAGTIAAGALHTCAVDAERRPVVLGTRQQRPDRPGADGRHDGPRRGCRCRRESRAALSVATGDAHTCVVGGDAMGTPLVACFGANDRGQLGDGTTTTRATPAGVVFGGAAPVPPVVIAAGGAHTCAADGAGRLWCWGRGDRGQLGTGGTDDRLAPGELALPDGNTVAVASRRAKPTPAPSIRPGASGAGARTTAGSSAPARLAPTCRRRRAWTGCPRRP